MSNEKKVYSTGGNLGIFADAIERGLETIIDASNKATQKSLKDATGTTAPAPRTTTTTPATALPDLNTIEVTPVEVPKYDGEKKEKSRTEADGTRQWAEAAGEKMVQLEENIEKLDVEIKKIERDPNSKFSSTAQSLLTQLKASRENEKGKLNQLLSVGNEAAKAHMEFSALLAEIRGTDPSHLGEVRNLISRVVKTGRYRLATEAEIKAAKAPEGKRPMGTIFFEGKIYYSSHEEKSPGQRALEAELRKLVDAAKFSKAASIKERGNADLTGFEFGQEGPYYLYSPKRTVEKKDGTSYKVSEGHALVEVKDINKGKTYFDREKRKEVKRDPYMVIEVRDACDGLGKLAGEGRKSVPHFWVKENRIILPKDRDTGKTRRLDDDDFKRALWMIHTFRNIFQIWDDARKKAMDSVNAVVPADMAGIEVIPANLSTDKTQTDPPAPMDTPLLPAPEPTPAPEKKPRKAKKTSAEKAE